MSLDSMDRIEPLKKETTKNFSDREIKSVWVETNGKIQKREQSAETIQEIIIENKAPKESMAQKLQKTLKECRDSIICIYAPLLEKECIELVENIAQANRIYIYTKEQERQINTNAQILKEAAQQLFGTQTHTKPQTNMEQESLLQALSAHALIRTGSKVAGSFVLIQKDSSIQGFFHTKTLFNTESNQLGFLLDSMQCNEFWHYFISCFWQNASFEYIAKKKREVEENNQSDFMPPFQNGFDSNFARKNLINTKQTSTLHITKHYPFIESLQGFRECIFYLQDSKLLGDAVLQSDTKSEFFVSNVGFDFLHNEIAISDNGAFLYSVGLNEEQRKEVAALQESFAITKEFQHSITLGQIVGKNVCYLDESKAVIESKQTREMVLSCKRFVEQDEFMRIEPDYEGIWKEFYAHTCELDFIYHVKPFYTPKEYTAARLYAEWENTYNAFQSSIESIRKGIESARKKEEELNFLSALLEGAKKLFKQFFLGQKTSLDAIERDIETIKTELKENNLSREDSQKFLTILQQCSNNLHIQSGEIDIKLDEAKAHNKWQEEKNKLEKDIEKLQQTCQTKQKELHAKQAEHKDKEAHIDSMQKEIENLSQKEIEKNNLQKELDKLKISKDIQAKTNQKQNIESKLNVLKLETKNLDSKRKECNKAKQDNNALKQHIATEEEKLQKNESELKNLQNELEKEYKTFSYNPNKQKDSKSPLSYMDTGSAKNTKKDSTIAISIPKENRPSVGILKENNDTRLLEIEFWSEVEEAKNEAERLNAKLSVKPLA